ncbi:MAG: SDR family oxidoreductase [Alphaproteobacteria bacterium]|nr:SDR family oxidoreductase [Alphaproteobacteria bacterium]
MTGVSGRVALVTGAGSRGGIGFASARLLKQAGARVGITSTTERIFDRLAELPSVAADAFAATADLTDPAQVEALIAEGTAALGPIDILVNNAGMVQTGVEEESQRLHEIDDAQWRRGLDRNLSTAFFVTRAVLPGMIERGYGRIVQMSSVTGPVVSNPKATIYGAAKAGMLGLTRALAIEVADRNITVNAIGPGWIETPSSSAEEIFAGKNTPVGRPGTADEIGHVVVFLAGEEASYLTGQLIVVDGGNTIQEYKGPAEGYY